MRALVLACDTAQNDCVAPATLSLFVMGQMKGARAKTDGRCSKLIGARARCGSDVACPTSVNHRRRRSRTRHAQHKV